MVALGAPLLPWVCLAASFVIVLAAVVQMAGPPPDGDAVSGVIRLPAQVTVAIVSLFALAAAVFLVDLVRRGLSRWTGAGEAERAEESARMPPWLRRLTQILSLLNVVVLAYLMWRGGLLQGGLFPAVGGLASGFALPGPVPATAPAVLNWAFGILGLAAGLGAFVLALWAALGNRPAQGHEDVAGGPPAAPLEAAVEEGLEDLRFEPDPRRAIVRCYARFERAAADSGLERKPWFTPMEFMREALVRLPVPRAAVPTLTGLFELARFSHHALGPSERDRALEALQKIRTAMEARDRDADAT